MISLTRWWPIWPSDMASGICPNCSSRWRKECPLKKPWKKNSNPRLSAWRKIGSAGCPAFSSALSSEPGLEFQSYSHESKGPLLYCPLAWKRDGTHCWKAESWSDGGVKPDGGKPGCPNGQNPRNVPICGELEFCYRYKRSLRPGEGQF